MAIYGYLALQLLLIAMVCIRVLSLALSNRNRYQSETSWDTSMKDKAIYLKLHRTIGEVYSTKTVICPIQSIKEALSESGSTFLQMHCCMYHGEFNSFEIISADRVDLSETDTIIM